MRMCLVMHCPMVLWWGCSLGALSLLFLCGVPQNVAAGPVGCVALQMLFVVHSLAMAASHHSTRAVYFAAITIFKAQAATIEVTASSGGVGGTEPTYQFSDLSGTPVATLIGNVSNGDITASGDLKTGSGDSVSAMAAEIKALKANYAALAAKIALLESIFLSPPATPPMLSPPKPPPTTPPFTGMETCYLGEVKTPVVTISTVPIKLAALSCRQSSFAAWIACASACSLCHLGLATCSTYTIIMHTHLRMHLGG